MGFPNIWNSIPRPNLTHLATYICVYMCACAQVRVGVGAHTHIHTYIHTHAHWYGCTHTRVYTYMCIYPTHSVTAWNIHTVVFFHNFSFLGFCLFCCCLCCLLFQSAISISPFYLCCIAMTNYTNTYAFRIITTTQ